jgi:hypothetical protein
MPEAQAAALETLPTGKEQEHKYANEASAKSGTFRTTVTDK